MNPKEKAEQQLGLIAQMRKDPDWETASPQTKAFFEGKERQYAATLRNLARAGVESDLAGMRQAKDYNKAELYEHAGDRIRPKTPEEEAAGQISVAPGRGKEAAAALESQAQDDYSVGRKGYGSALGHHLGAAGITALGATGPVLPAVEALGSMTSKEGERGLLPQTGDSAQYIESSPDPFLSKATGMLVAAVPGGVPGGATAMRPMGTLFRGNEAMLGKFGQLLPPGAGRTKVLAGAMTGGEVALADAGIRRFPAAVDKNQAVEPLDPAGEVLPSVVMGGAGALPNAARTGARAWATNPKTETGITATRWATNQRSGRNAQLEQDFPRGNIGVQQAKQAADKGVEYVRGVVKAETQRGMQAAEPPIKARTREDLSRNDEQLERGLGEVEMERGRTAASIEPDFDARFTELRIATNNRLARSLDAVNDAPIDVTGIHKDIRSIVANEARPGSGGATTTREVDTGLVTGDKNPVPIMRTETVGPTGSAEAHTPYGKKLRALEVEALSYLPAGQPATVKGVRNFIKFLKSKADSGSPEESFPAKQMIGAVRKHLYEQNTTAAEALDRWKAGTKTLEDARQRFYGSEDMHKQGIEGARDAVDAPEVDAPFTPQRVSPAEQLAGRRRLMGVGRPSPDEAIRAPDRPAMEEAGFGEPLDRMTASNRALDQRAAGMRRQAEEAAATRREAEGREIAAEKARLEGRAGQAVERSQRAGDELVQDKFAQEAARFTGNRKLLRPLAWGAAGVTSPSPHHMAMAAAEGLGIMDSIKIPVASRLALTPPAAAVPGFSLPGAAIPGSLDYTLTLKRREPRDQVKELINGARGQRLRATIGEQLLSKENRQ